MAAVTEPTVSEHRACSMATVTEPTVTEPTVAEPTVYSVSYKTRCWMTWAGYSQFVEDTQGCEALQQWDVMVEAGATTRQRPSEQPSLTGT